MPRDDRRALSPDLRRLLSAQAVSWIGNAMAPVALAPALLDLGFSGVGLGAVIASRMVTQMVVVLLGGVWADRSGRKALMVGSDLLAGAGQAVSALMLLAGVASLPVYIAVQVVAGAAAAVQYPAASGALPILIGDGDPRRVNALRQLGTNGGQILGGVVVTVLLAYGSSPLAVGADAASFVVSAVLIGRIRDSLRSAAADAAPRNRILTDLRQGWHEVVRHRWIVTLLIQCFVVAVASMGAYLVLGPVILHGRSHGPQVWAESMTAQAVGLLVASFVALRLRVRRPLLVADAAIFLVPVPLLLLSLHASVPLFLLASFLAGAAKSILVYLWTLTLQARVAGHLLSRVSAYDALATYTAAPAGTLSAGLAAAFVGAGPALIAFAGLAWVAAAAGIATKAVRGLVVDVAPAAETSPEPAETLTG